MSENKVQTEKRATKKCPYCYEEIKAEARKCRFCRSNLTASLTSVTWSRDVPGRKWLGVASVLALNSGIPVLAWRVAFIISSLFHGVGHEVSCLGLTITQWDSRPSIFSVMGLSSLT